MKRIFFLSIVLTLIAVFFSSLLFAEDKPYTVRITDIKGNEAIIEDFKIHKYYEDSGCKYFDAMWNNSSVKFGFEEISQIIFTNELEPYKFAVEVLFKDGRKDKFRMAFEHATGKSKFGGWRMYSSRMKKINFLSSGTTSESSTSTSEYDSIILKNGDAISGTIINKAWSLKASYGDLNFGSSEIDLIDFEGAGQNIDIISLKLGDKISGVVQNNIINIRLVSGAELKIDKDKIKTIRFKK